MLAIVVVIAVANIKFNVIVYCGAIGIMNLTIYTQFNACKFSTYSSRLLLELSRAIVLCCFFVIIHYINILWYEVYKWIECVRIPKKPLKDQDRLIIFLFLFFHLGVVIDFSLFEIPVSFHNCDPVYRYGNNRYLFFLDTSHISHIHLPQTILQSSPLYWDYW